MRISCLGQSSRQSGGQNPFSRPPCFPQHPARHQAVAPDGWKRWRGCAGSPPPLSEAWGRHFPCRPSRSVIIKGMLVYLLPCRWKRPPWTRTWDKKRYAPLWTETARLHLRHQREAVPENRDMGKQSGWFINVAPGDPFQHQDAHRVSGLHS